MNHREKLPLSSKKFIAYLISELTWKAVLIVALFTLPEAMWSWIFMVSTVTVAGFVEIGFIGGQAYLDKYVRIAEIAAEGVRGERTDQ